MEALGIDVTSRGARAVVVNAAGAVRHTASYAGTDAAASLKAAEEGMKRSVDAALGIATDDPALAGAAALGKLSSGGPPPVVCRAGDALVFAEAWIGAAKGARHAVCLWLGDRVLAGVLLNGEAWRGAHGLAGSAAWLALNPAERQDYWKLGSLAAEVNDQGIARRLAWRIQAGDESAVLERAGSLDALNAAHVFDGARAADGVAISVVRDTARYIAMAVVNLAVAIDPEVVVIGGPIAFAKDLLLEPVRQDFARRMPSQMAGQIRCEFSPLGEDAIAIGAARLAVLART